MPHKLQNAIRHAAQTEVMPHFLNTPSFRKEDGSMLSEADLVAQTAFVAALLLLIGCPMLGEEMTTQQQTDLWHNHSDGLWIADPTDGTDNFVGSLPHFTVSVAYVQHGCAQLGVIYNPASGERSYAERGRSASLNDTPLLLHLVGKKLGEAIADIEIKYLRLGKLSNRLDTLAPLGTIRSMSSSTSGQCYLAYGRYDAYTHGGQKLWGYAAGALIFKEAGGCLNISEGNDFWSSEHVFKRSVAVAL